MKPFSVILMGAWFAVLGGFAQVGVLAVGQTFYQEIPSSGPHRVWMVPVANLALFAIPATTLALLVRWAPRQAWRGLALWVFSLLAFLNLTLLIKGMHQAVGILLAAGLASATTRFVEVRWSGYYTVVRKTLVPLGALVMALAGLVFGWEAYAERRMLARLPNPVPGTPNVLLLVWDTVRAMNLSLYGYSRSTTPELERLAERGLVARRALVSAPWTLPSHAGMFTGRMPHELSANWRIPLNDRYPTLAGVLASHGYLTGGFVANLIYGHRYFGLGRGFLHYEDFPLSLGEIAVSSKLSRDLLNAGWFRRLIGYHDYFGRQSAEDITDSFLKWLSRHRERPFFAFLNYFDAHEPYLPPPAYHRLFGSPSLRKNWLNRQRHHEAKRTKKERMSREEIQWEVDAYDGGIAYIDAQVGRLLDELTRRGLRERTIIIITSDHGEQFGEHGLFDHGQSLYRPLLEVPLVISYPPGVAGPVVLQEAVSLRDLPATVLDLLGIENRDFPGASWRRYWTRGPQVQREASEPVIAGMRWKGRRVLASVFADGLQYIRHPEQGEEVFDWRVDPGEDRNLLDSLGGSSTLAALRATLDSALGKSVAFKP